MSDPIDMTYGYAKTIQSYYDESFARLSAMPRHLLGSMTCDLRVLAALDAEVSYLLTEEDPEQPLSNGFRLHIRKMLTEVVRDADGVIYGNIFIRAKAEVFIWRERDGLENRELTAQQRIYLHRLKIPIEIPAALPYAEAGIDDVELIKTCIANGIDVDTALALNSVRQGDLLGLVAA